jgi:hypothetical protein
MHGEYLRRRQDGSVKMTGALDSSLLVEIDRLLVTIAAPHTVCLVPRVLLDRPLHRILHPPPTTSGDWPAIIREKISSQ